MSPSGSTNPLPEERLLKLIRAKAAPAGSAGGGVSSTSLAPGTRVKGPRWFPLALSTLSIALMIQLGMLVQQWLAPAPLVPAAAPEPPLIDAPAADHQTDDLLADLPRLSESATRPLFGSLMATTTAEPVAAATPSTGPSESAQDLSTRLSLMGIMGGEPPQAIIQDAKTQKTFFVSPGQAVTEGAVLKRVLENRVILDLRGEEIELAL